MTQRTVVGLMGLALATGVLTSQVLSQEKPAEPAKSAGPDMPDRAAMMKQWQAVARPGKDHKLLDNFVGEWKTTTKIWMGGPGTPPSQTEGRSTIKWVLGNRFIQEELDSEIVLPSE